ncbi:hypothetical protein WCX49_11745 [Sulfurimonas sp. HSL-1656]|uniref:hypothetical protein n=1 Tax=Thiomicrolovo subterrani TaxID=3131934 RepID=UPI0031FA125E
MKILDIALMGVAAMLLAGCAGNSYVDTAGEVFATPLYTKSISCTDGNGSVVQVKKGDDDFEYNGDFFEGSIYTKHGLFFMEGEGGSAVVIAYPNDIRISYNDGGTVFLDCNDSDRFGAPLNYTMTEPEYAYASWQEVDAEIERMKQAEIARKKAIEQCRKENPAWLIEKKCRE